MKIAIFVEDKYYEPYRILARKIMGKQTGLEIRWKKRHDLLKYEKIYNYISCDILQEHPDISKIIVCVDSECTPETETEKEIKKVENLLRKRIPVSISSVVVNHALEGWLLADTETIQSYMGSMAEVNIPSSATHECRPKEVMKDIFRKANREFLPTRDNLYIAEKIDLQKVAKRNQSFARFQEQVKDP